MFHEESSRFVQVVRMVVIVEFGKMDSFNTDHPANAPNQGLRVMRLLIGIGPFNGSRLENKTGQGLADGGKIEVALGGRARLIG